jgi:hypothetical protein
MRKSDIADEKRQPIIAGFTREDFARLNRSTHARNLLDIIKSTKWLNDHGLELLRRHPGEFHCVTGMTVEQYQRALAVHVDCCRAFLERI